MFKLLIFDLDGTLFDTAPGIARAMHRLMRERGEKPLPDELIRTFIGLGLSSLIAQLDDATQNRLGSRDKLLEDFRRHYKSTFLEETEPFPGVVEFLRGWPNEIAIVSNKHDDYIYELISRSPLAQFSWRHICGGNTHEQPKPSAIPLYAAMREAHAMPEQTLMIGDGLPDIIAAQNAGVRSIAIEFGYTPVVDLISAGAHARLKSYSDLSQLIQMLA